MFHNVDRRARVASPDGACLYLLPDHSLDLPAPLILSVRVSAGDVFPRSGKGTPTNAMQS